MQIDIKNLPNDTDFLKKLLCENQKNFQKINAEIIEKNIQLQLHIENLQHELHLYKIKRYQSKSEKFKDGGPIQADLFPEELQKILVELNIGHGSKTAYFGYQ